MTGQHCPHCGSDAGVYRYTRAMIGLGILLYVGILGLALYTGMLVGVLRENQFMSDTSLSGGYQIGLLISVLCTLTGFIALLVMSTYEKCEHCGYEWRRTLIRH